MTETIFGTTLMLVSIIIMLAILSIGIKKVSALSFTHPYLIKCISFFSFYKVLAYYLLPFIMELFNNYRYVREEKIGIDELGVLYFIEAMSWITWLAGLLLIAFFFRGKYLNINKGVEFFQKDTFSKIFLVTLTLFYLPLSVIIAAENYGLKTFPVPLWIESFKALIAYAAPPSSVLLMVLAVRKWGFGYLIIGLIGFMSTLAVISTRGAFVYSFIFFIFLLYITSPNKFRTMRKIFFATTVFISIYFVLGGLPILQLEPDATGLRIKLGISTEKKQDRTALEEIEWRFGAASRHSVAFIRMYERGDSAGLNPIMNSLKGFLPRSINPDKPHPSTVDGDDIYSQGMYLIYREIYGYDTFSMTEFSSGGHAYWELGILGVILLPFLSGIYIGLCAYYFKRFGIASLALMLAIFKPFGYVDPKIWVSDIAIQLYQLILPLISIFLIYNLANRFKEKFRYKRSSHVIT